MLTLRREDEFKGVSHDAVICTVCPVMKTFILPLSFSALGVRESLSTNLGVEVESVELYTSGAKGLIPVSDESLGVGHYFVLLRIRAGKGGFRKQLEKKGRAFARARRLRGYNQGGSRPRSTKVTELISTKGKEPKGAEIPENSSSGGGRGGKEKKQLSNTVISKIRDAVCVGVKRVVENLGSPSP